MQVVPLASRLTFLDLLTPTLTVWCHLYRQDVELGWWTQKADLLEMDAPGYSAQPIFGWGTAQLSGPFALTQADPVLFERVATGPVRDAWGYYFTLNQDGPLLTAERFDAAPVPFDLVSTALVVVPRLQLRVQQEVTSEPLLPTVAGGGIVATGDADSISP